ncbi:MAG TPA: nucleotidyltransferase domain-containing protein [Limnochordia bacterium]
MLGVAAVDDREMQSYVNAWRRRGERAEAARRARVAAAWDAARALAALLRQEFGASEVWVFGSLALDARGIKTFRRHSDIDLAARGIPKERFFAAQGRLLMAADFPVDLIDLDDCPPSWQKTVARDGIPLGN